MLYLNYLCFKSNLNVNMKLKLLSLVLIGLCNILHAEKYFIPDPPPTIISVYEDAVFYDMYAATVNQPLPADAIRQSNSSYTKMLTESQLDSFGNKLTMNITIGALCDNYDRLANVYLALVTKGSADYDTNSVTKLELGRFITPFMNKNVSPTSVPYTFQMDNVAAILKDPVLRSQYDFWIEFVVLGVPYAAQTQVSGCAGRIDTFKGSLSFTTTTTDSSITATNNFLLPMTAAKSLNNYSATDVPGQTIRMLSFVLNAPVNNANFYLITSNHGANSGGEEYIRRQHFISLNDQPIYNYTPGGKSCEPYRQYNTQGNGIYGSSAQSTSWWTSWNNWCPGDAVPIRKIPLGNMQAGSYTFQINVPSAQFVGQQGDFPLSVYFQGEKQNVLSTSDVKITDIKIYPNPVVDVVKISSTKKVKATEVYSSDGRLLRVFKGNEADISEYQSGLYILNIIFDGGMSLKHKIIKK